MISLLAAAATAAVATAGYTPALAWGHVAQGHAEHFREVEFGDLASSFRSLGSADAAAPGSLLQGNAKARPEVQLVFLAEGLTTDAVRALGGRLANVQKLMQGAASSLQAPFVKPSTVGLGALAAAPRVSGEEAEAYLSKRPELFTNGAPDLLVVELRALAGATEEQLLAAHDALVGRISAAVDAASRGSYAALVTSPPPAAAARRRLAATSQKGIRTTPTLLTAQLISLILIVIFMSGFCCLFQLQTPKRFNVDKHA